jgi:predicted ATPase/DNA-binding XRE family transcriptional regulator
MSETRMGFGELLRRLRCAAALSQEDLAERAGLSRNGISDLERGLHPSPRLETVRLLADGLALTDDERATLVAAARPAVWEELSAACATLPSVSLPTPLTRLIGRETELVTLRGRLREDAVRWLTLTGPGGVGKTRLAIAVAGELHEIFPDGVVFVDLAPLADSNLVIATIAATLGVREAARRPLITTLAVSLAPKRVLLVLDNCERVLATAPDLTTLLAASPGLTIFATSREPFHVRGEHESPLLPLSLPTSDQLSVLDALAPVPAMALFVERAAATQPGFALTAQNAVSIASICSRLDGLPLAIELAAARVKVLPPDALLARLEHRLPLLSGGGHDLPARQRTMRDAIAWSYDLLSSEEQSLFRRLAVFAGGFTLTAAEVVAASAEDLPVLHGVVALVEQSLLRAEDGTDEPRFRMLETVREFGLEALADSSEEDAIRRRHCGWYLALAERAEPELVGREQARWLAQLAVEHDNLRAALAWATEQREGTALRMASALIRFWRFRCHPSEGMSWLQQALAQVDGAPLELQARAALGAGIMASLRADHVGAAEWHAQALAQYRYAGDGVGTANALVHLGEALQGQGDDEAAVALFEESLALFRGLGDRTGIMAPTDKLIKPLKNLGRVARRRGDYAQAQIILEEALTLCREIEYSWGVASSLHYLGEVARDRREWHRAASLFRESLSCSRVLGDTLGIGCCLGELGGVATALGRPEQGARLLGASAGMHEAMGFRAGPGEARVTYAALNAARDALGDATFAAAWVAGQRLPLDHAIAEGMTVAQAAECPPKTR